MKYLFFLFALCLGAPNLLHADFFSERPDFSLLLHTGVDYPTGYIPGNSPNWELGAWMGLGIDDHLDGYFGVDDYTMPNQPFTLTQAKASDPVTVVTPTDDLSLSVDTRWYPFNTKWDYARHHYTISPYLLIGFGMDLLVDDGQPLGVTPVPPSFPAILNTSYDLLFGMNFGAGVDFPVGDGRRWSIYAEGLDHLIFWTGTTQVFDAHVGVRFMLDTAHVDPLH